MIESNVNLKEDFRDLINLWDEVGKEKIMELNKQDEKIKQLNKAIKEQKETLKILYSFVESVSKGFNHMNQEETFYHDQTKFHIS